MTDDRLWFKVHNDDVISSVLSSEHDVLPRVSYPSITDIISGPLDDDAVDPDTWEIAVVHATQEEVEYWSDQHTQLAAEFADIAYEESIARKRWEEDKRVLKNQRTAAMAKYEATHAEMKKRLHEAWQIRVQHEHTTAPSSE